MINPKLTSPGWRVSGTLLLPVAGLIVGIWEVHKLNEWTAAGIQIYPYRALIFASAGAILLFAGLELVAFAGPPNRRKYGWLAITIGKDGRLSTSKVQYLVWTIVLGIGLLYVTGIVVFGHQHADKLFDKTNWDQYLVLLGGPFLGLVLAKAAVVSKLDQGTIQKSTTPAAALALLEPQSPPVAPPAPQAGVAALGPEGQPAPAPAAVPAPAGATGKDVLTTDDGEIDLPDTQYFLFNIVALVYVVGAYVSTVTDATLKAPERFAFPVVPSVLLGLTSLAAAGYVSNKAVQKDGPKISNILQSGAAADRKFDIAGVNLVAPGTTDAEALAGTTVTLRGVPLPADTATTDVPNGIVGVIAAAPTQVSFVLPAGYAGRDVDVRVVTARSVATEPFRITGM